MPLWRVRRSAPMSPLHGPADPASYALCALALLGPTLPSVTLALSVRSSHTIDSQSHAIGENPESNPQNINCSPCHL